MKNALLPIYTEMMLYIHTGSINGKVALSKPLYITSIIEAIEWDALTENEIMISNDFIRKRFGQLYEQVNGNKKDMKCHSLSVHSFILAVPLSII